MIYFQHKIEIEKIENECLQRTNDSHDMMKNVTLQNETLSSTFKVNDFMRKNKNSNCWFQEQIASIEADHERSILILQNQLQTCKQENEQLKIRIDSLRQTNIENEKELSQMIVNNDISKEDLPWTFSERQQGEVKYFLSMIAIFLFFSF